MNCHSVPIASVVIPTWCRRAALRRLLFSIARQVVAPEIEIIVADSNSPDGTDDMLARFSRRVMPVIQVVAANAPAAKRNAGAAIARAQVLVFLDDDMRFDSKLSLGVVLDEMKTSSGPVCLRVTYPPDWCAKSNYYRYKQMAHDDTNSGELRLEPWRFVSMAFAINRSQYLSVGGFDESFKVYGCEDHAFEFLLKKLSIIPMLSSSVRILHLEDSRSFVSYRSKLVVTAAYGMPLLIEKWPGALAHTGIAVMEGRIAAAILMACPQRLLQMIGGAIGRLLDALPVRTPSALLLLAARLFAAAAYLEGRSLRARI